MSHTIFFVCTCKLFAFCVCTRFPHTDTRITHHVFVCNRNKLVLEMLMSSCFTCDKGKLQTGHPRFYIKIVRKITESIRCLCWLSAVSGDPVSCCINNQSYGCWNKEKIKVAVTKQCTGTRSYMVIELHLYSLDGYIICDWLWAFSTALWFYKHRVPNTLYTCTCMQSHHICVYLHFFLECCAFYTHVPCVWHATHI